MFRAASGPSLAGAYGAAGQQSDGQGCDDSVDWSPVARSSRLRLQYGQIPDAGCQKNWWPWGQVCIERCVIPAMTSVFRRSARMTNLITSLRYA
jgi:hypothetical protein